MKSLMYLIVLIFSFLFMGIENINAQGRLLRKLQNEAENKAIEKILNKEEEDKTKSENESEDNRTTRNRSGGGLSQNIPDVENAITEASNSFLAGDYQLSKASLRDAIWGIELEMGQNVLKSLPEKIQSLDAVSANDKVTSSGMGFVGMLIERTYSGSDDMEFVVSVGNDAAILGIASMMAAGDMFRNSQENPDQKQIRFQDHRAIIEYDDYSGYTLTAPFGQSSILVLKGVNFESETDFMAAADKIDLSVIKQKLGDQ